MTKTIEYTPNDYKIIKTLQLKDDYGFQIIQFPNKHYGIMYINPKKNINGITLISTDKNDLGAVAFLKFAELAHKIPSLDEIDKVKLVVMVNPDDQEVYREIINSDEAKTLIEKLEISREISQIKRENSLTNKYGEQIETITLGLLIFSILLLIANLIGMIL